MAKPVPAEKQMEKDALAEAERSGRMTDLKKYAKLDQQKRKLKDDLKKIDAELELIEPVVVDFFEKNSVPRMTVGKITIYLKRTLWASKAEGVTYPALKDTLDKLGLGDFIGPRLNTQTMSAYVRKEYDRHQEEIQEAELALQSARKSDIPGVFETAEIELEKLKARSPLNPDLAAALNVSENVEIGTRKGQ